MSTRVASAPLPPPSPEDLGADIKAVYGKLASRAATKLSKPAAEQQRLLQAIEHARATRLPFLVLGDEGLRDQVVILQNVGTLSTYGEVKGKKKSAPQLGSQYNRADMARFFTENFQPPIDRSAANTLPDTAQPALPDASATMVPPTTPPSHTLKPQAPPPLFHKHAESRRNIECSSLCRRLFADEDDPTSDVDSTPSLPALPPGMKPLDPLCDEDFEFDEDFDIDAFEETSPKAEIIEEPTPQFDPAAVSPAVDHHLTFGSVMYDGRWWILLNDCFMLGAILGEREFHVAFSKKIKDTLIWDSRAKRPRVLGRELIMLNTAGYQLIKGNRHLGFVFAPSIDGPQETRLTAFHRAIEKVRSAAEIQALFSTKHTNSCARDVTS